MMNKQPRLNQLLYPLIALALTAVLLILHSQLSVKSSSLTINKKNQPITITHSGFLPQNLHCRQGETVSLMITNIDNHVHNFTIPDLRVFSANIQPNQTATLEFKAGQKGTYLFVSNSPGYPETGYRGTVTIE
ncbi:cupredoxin domain-containing protein [Brevibacillus fulvus]|uniref:Cupredoxin-like copper-binding protein n=1 Tax=Brevibacillus fulvus TaxID=1125967 RepID=A0A939BPZ4_9BACL|nr:cupredoxin domain-containing protein [Brevibacillus fulvus]MBM7591060.1 putative cupredoxin-like copper-binding protein [Brevibacillus fulvus]